MISAIHHALSVVICKNAADAVAQGYNYVENPAIKPIRVEKVVVVQNGMESGKASVDFILRAEDGQEYVFLITGRLLKSIPC